jgi:hypothetical protein
MNAPRKRKGKYAVGDRVRIIYGFGGNRGEVVEDRGNIGVNGMRLYDIKVQMDEWNEMTTALPEDYLEPAADKCSLNGEAKLNSPPRHGDEDMMPS